MRINLGSGDYPELVISLGDLTKEVPIVRIYNNRSDLLSFASIVESKQTPELIQLIESFQVKVLQLMGENYIASDIREREKCM